MGENTTKKFDSTFAFKWIISLVITAFVWMIPTSELYTQQIHVYLTVTVFAILVMALELFDLMIVGFALPLAYLLLGLAPADVVYGPWMTNSIWMLAGVMALSKIMDRTGLLQRIAYGIIKMIGGGFKGLLVGITIAGALLNMALGGNAMPIYAVLVFAICRALDIVGTKESAMIMMTAIIGGVASSQCFLNLYALVSMDSQTVVAFDISWMEWFIDNAIFYVWIAFCVVLAWFLIKPDGNKINPQKLVQEKYAELGPWTKEQKIGLVVLVGILLAMLTNSIHHLAIGWIFVIGVTVLYLPGIKVGTGKDLDSVSFAFIAFSAACIAIGSVGGALGFGDLVQEMIYPLLEGKAPSVLVVLVLILSCLGNLIMTPISMAAALSQPIMQVAVSLGVSSKATLYAFVLGMEQVLLPYESMFIILTMSFGCIQLKQFIKVYGIKAILSIPFVFLVAIPYWKLLGVM